jgi:hypothetical protein
MAEQTDIDLDSVIDRLLEGESMFHLTTNLPTSPIRTSTPPSNEDLIPSFAYTLSMTQSLPLAVTS